MNSAKYRNFDPQQLKNLKAIIDYGEAYAISLSLRRPNEAGVMDAPQLGFTHPAALCLFHPDLPNSEFFFATGNVYDQTFYAMCDSILTSLAVIGVEVCCLRSMGQFRPFTWEDFDPTITPSDEVRIPACIEVDSLILLCKEISIQPPNLDEVSRRWKTFSHPQPTVIHSEALDKTDYETVVAMQLREEQLAKGAGMMTWSEFFKL